MGATRSVAGTPPETAVIAAPTAQVAQGQEGYNGRALRDRLMVGRLTLDQVV